MNFISHIQPGVRIVVVENFKEKKHTVIEIVCSRNQPEGSVITIDIHYFL